MGRRPQHPTHPAALQALLCLAGCDSELLTDTWLCSVCSVGRGEGMGGGLGFLVTALTPDGLSTLRPSLLEVVVEGELRG